MYKYILLGDKSLMVSLKDTEKNFYIEFSIYIFFLIAFYVYIIKLNTNVKFDLILKKTFKGENLMRKNGLNKMKS